ncbi:hypothetical protein LEMLEM_LOCUS19148 [Lemmus lemmus]
MITGYKRVLALPVETEYNFPLAEKVQIFLAAPAAIRAALAAAPVKAEALKPGRSAKTQMKI